MRYALPMLLVLWLAQSANAETLKGRIITCHDGDTCTLRDDAGHKYRISLAGIDAPERRGATWPPQSYSEASRQHLVGLTKGKTAMVEWRKLDQHGRIVGRVLVNGADIGLDQVRAGYAWWYRQYAREQSPEDRHRYSEAEKQARAAAVGLWADGDAVVPPWEWRKRQSSNRLD